MLTLIETSPRLDRGARSARNRLKPASQGVVLMGQRKAHCFGGEIDGHQAGDVGRRKMIAGNEGQRSQTGVEIGVEVFHPKPAALDQRRNLIVVVWSGNRAALQL